MITGKKIAYVRVSTAEQNEAISKKMAQSIILSINCFVVHLEWLQQEIWNICAIRILLNLLELKGILVTKRYNDAT